MVKQHIWEPEVAVAGEKEHLWLAYQYAKQHSVFQRCIIYNQKVAQLVQS